MSTKDVIVAHLEQVDSATGRDLRDHLGISRQALNSHIRPLLASGRVVKSGSTRNARYYASRRAPASTGLSRSFPLRGQGEHQVYENIAIRLNLRALLRPNVLSLVEYAFTGMLNNAIDHSRSAQCRVSIQIGPGNVWFQVRDHGIGMFHSIADKLGLDDEYAAMIELVKGKTAIKSTSHAGEGIFFTAKCADRLKIRSHRIQLEWDRARGDVFVSERRFTKGTTVEFNLRRDTRMRLANVFSTYGSREHDCQFNKTNVMVKLVKTEYVSRSEARQLLANLETCDEIELSFKDVKQMGQGFADEIFRVFANRHPGIKIRTVRINPTIAAMIRHVRDQH